MQDPKQAKSTALNDFEFLGKLGKGSFGVVYKVKRKADKCIYVLKQIKIAQMDAKLRTAALNEVKILSSLDNPYIVKYYDSFLEKNLFNIVMEFCEGGDLENYIQNQSGRPLNENKIWKFFLQMCIGLDYLHRQKILHRDIKSMNIFLSKDEDIRIGDLGVAKILCDSANFAYTMVGTPYYLSPEMCEEKPYNEKSDVWALGCVLYEMCTQKHPFQANNQAALILKIIRGKYTPIPSIYSPELSECIDLCLSKNDKKRPTIAELLSKPVLTNKAAALNINLKVGSNEEKKPQIKGKSIQDERKNKTEKVSVERTNRQLQNEEKDQMKKQIHSSVANLLESEKKDVSYAVQQEDRVRNIQTPLIKKHELLSQQKADAEKFEVIGNAIPIGNFYRNQVEKPVNQMVIPSGPINPKDNNPAISPKVHGNPNVMHNNFISNQKKAVQPSVNVPKKDVAQAKKVIPKVDSKYQEDKLDLLLQQPQSKKTKKENKKRIRKGAPLTLARQAAQAEKMFSKHVKNEPQTSKISKPILENDNDKLIVIAQGKIPKSRGSERKSSQPNIAIKEDIIYNIKDLLQKKRTKSKSNSSSDNDLSFNESKGDNNDYDDSFEDVNDRYDYGLLTSDYKFDNKESYESKSTNITARDKRDNEPLHKHPLPSEGKSSHHDRTIPLENKNHRSSSEPNQHTNIIFNMKSKHDMKLKVEHDNSNGNGSCEHLNEHDHKSNRAHVDDTDRYDEFDKNIPIYNNHHKIYISNHDNDIENNKLTDNDNNGNDEESLQIYHVDENEIDIGEDNEDNNDMNESYEQPYLEEDINDDEHKQNNHNNSQGILSDENNEYGYEKEEGQEHENEEEEKEGKKQKEGDDEYDLDFEDYDMSDFENSTNKLNMDMINKQIKKEQIDKQLKELKEKEHYLDNYIKQKAKECIDQIGPQNYKELIDFLRVKLRIDDFTDQDQNEIDEFVSRRLKYNHKMQNVIKDIYKILHFEIEKETCQENIKKLSFELLK